MAGSNRASPQTLELLRALESAPHRFNFFQALRLIEAHNRRDAAAAGNLQGIFEPLQGVDGGTNLVVRVTGTQRLGQNVLDAGAFEHSPYTTAGDDARTR